MDDILPILRKNKLFDGMEDAVILQQLLPRGNSQTYAKGQYLIQPQQVVDRFAIVLSGKVNIIHIFPEGNYSLLTALPAGEILGADLICTRTRISPHHAVAVLPTEVLYFPVELLTERGILTEPLRQMILNNLLTLISNENIKKEYRLTILSQKGLRERILTYLTMQANRRKETTFSISFSREELAAFLCVNRSALSHELSLMQQEGLITFRKNVFTVHFL